MYQIPTPSATTASSASAPLVPLKCYRVHATKVTNVPSKSSGLPMTTVHVQILSPSTVANTNGTISETAGIEGDLRFVFNDTSWAKILDKVRALGVTFPTTHNTYEDAVKAVQDALAAQLVGITFEMVVSSKKEPMNGADGKPLTDSEGREIQGQERAEFAWFNIQGIPLPITSPALAAKLQ